MPGWVYILTNTHNTTLYTGVTSKLPERLEQHANCLGNSFTRRYNLHKLVYLEEYPTITEAITREKQLKAGSRKDKINLIITQNPDWNDLKQFYY